MPEAEILLPYLPLIFKIPYCCKYFPAFRSMCHILRQESVKRKAATRKVVHYCFSNSEFEGTNHFGGYKSFLVQLLAQSRIVVEDQKTLAV